MESKHITKKSWEGVNIFTGIDTHKKSWKVTILSGDYEHRTFSQDPSPVLLANYLNRNFPGASIHTVYEAGFCGYWISKELNRFGINNIIVNPADVPTKHKEKAHKSDKVDSRKLARALKSGDITGIYEPDDDVLAARQFLRWRSDLVKDLARQKNRLKSLFAFIGQAIPDQFSESASRQFSKRYISWVEGLSFEHPETKWTIESKLRTIQNLRNELLQVNKKLREIAKGDRFSQDMQLLLSVPGIGPLAAMTVLTELPPMQNFESSDKVNSFVGLVPNVYGSGEKEYVGRLTGRGNRRLKNIIIEASWVIIRKDPVMMLTFQELTKKMEGNKAIIRIARKLLSRIRRVLLTKKPYETGVY